MKHVITGLTILLLMVMTIPLQGQTGWGVDRYEGFRASVNNQGNISQIGWTTGNLGNAWDEGEWVPYCLSLKNVDMTVGASNFTPIRIKYDFTSANPAVRFVDLVRGVQVGVTGSIYFPLGSNTTGDYGWPSPAGPPLNGAPCPLTTASELTDAQNCQDANVWGGTAANAWKLLTLPQTQMNRDLTTSPLQYGGTGSPTDAEHCFTITYGDLTAAGISATYQGPMQIYFCLHLSQTFIWSLSLQDQLDVSPTDDWGGYLYSISPYDTDFRDGSGYVPGASGHTTLLGQGSRTVPIPIPPAPIGEISGLKYFDANANGVRDASESILEGWEIYISTSVGGTPISYTRVTDNTGAYSLTGLPGAVYTVSEKSQGLTPLASPPPNYPYAAFNQTPPSTWDESYPTTFSSINSGTVLGTATSTAGIALGYADVSWAVDLISTSIQGDVNFGNFIPPPECMVTASATSVCNDDPPVTLTAARIAEGTPPYTVSWSYSYAGSGTPSWTPPSSPTAFTFDYDPSTNPPGTYTFTAVLTDANGLPTPQPGCSATIVVHPLPTVSVSASPTAVCFGDPSTLTVTTNASSPTYLWDDPNASTTPSITVSPLTTTTYTVIVTDGTTGCDNSGSVTVTVNPLPVCSITPADPVCPNATTVHSAPAGMKEYLWGINGDGSIVGANNQQTVTVDAANICSGSYTLSLYIKDQNDCENNCSAAITVQDITPPTLTGTLPGGAQGNVCKSGAPGPPSEAIIEAEYSDDCGSQIIATFDPAQSGVTGDDCAWTATYVYKIKDICNNPAPDAVVKYTGGDTEDPVLSGVPNDVTIQCDESVPAPPTVTATDNCDPNPQVSMTETDTQDPDPTVCGHFSYTITRTWTATDVCSNSSSDFQTITVEDTKPPTFTRPSDITIYSDANCNYDAGVQYTGDVLDENDNCATGLQATFSDQTDASDPCNIVISRTWSLKDYCDNAAADQIQTITVKDNIPPTFTRPPDITIYRDANCGYDDDPSNTGDVTDEADNCGVGEATYADVVDNTDKCNVVITRTWSLVDNCGNAAADQVQTITVKDNTPPTFTRPADITIYRDANCNYDASIAVTGDVTDEDDNCDVGEATFADVVDNTDKCNVIITRTWSLVDDCGNAAADQIQTITVKDNIPPTFTRPPDITIYRDGTCDYDASLSQTGDVTDEADNCDVGEATYADVVDNTDPCNVIITRTWSLIDDCGNAAADQIQTITVKDNTPPTFTRPPDITIFRDANCGYDDDPSNTGDVTDEADNCGVGEATYADVVDNTDKCNVIITRTWSLVDDCGNAAADQVQTITVKDNTPPTFTRPPDITIYRDVNCNYDAGIAFTGDVTDEDDNCDVGEATFADVVDNTDKCNVIITRTWSLVDDCGNAAADQIQTITVKDNIPPTFTRPPDITIYRDANCNYDASIAVTGDVTDEDDNCDVGEATFADVVDKTDPCNVIITRTWSLVDDCGNAAADQIQTITVKDNIPPTFTRPPDITIFRDANCGYDDDPSNTGDVTDEADNCGVGEATYADVVDNTDKCNVIITRTWSLVDDCGNAAADQIQTITVKDNTPPTFTRPPDITIYRDANCNYDAGIAVTGDVTDEDDNCDVGEATFADVVDNTDKCNVIITRTWSLIDDCGNAAADQIQTITVKDNIPPTFTRPPDITIYRDANCNYDASIAVTGDVTDEDDNCDVGEATYADVIDNSDPCDVIIARTWSLVDDCGNAAPDQVQTIHVIDNMAPIWLNSPPQSITVPCATDPIPFWEPVVNVDYKDNCDQNPTLDLVIVHDIIPQPDGTKWHIRSWRVIDACNLSSTTVTQTIVELRCQFASLTQGFYGNSGGTWCGNGASTINLLNSLLTTPLVVGILNTGSFTVGIGEGNCVIQALPPLGNAYALTKDYSFNPQCSATPGSPPIMTRGRFENNLLTQAITFGLNLRLDPNLITDLYLPPPTLPYLWTIDADYVNGICLDGNDIEAGLPKSFYIPPAVLTAMGSNGSNRGLSDLRDFANRAIAGLSISPATLTEVLDALDAFNKGFDGARFFAGYHPMAAPKSVVREKLPENFALHQNHPNPFNPSTTITFTIPQECNVRLAVYNALGEEIAVLLDRSVPAGTHAVTWNSNTARTNLPSGVYTYRIHAQVPDGVDFHDVKKMMLVK